VGYPRACWIGSAVVLLNEQKKMQQEDTINFYFSPKREIDR
jgi:hypothetical protein